MILPSYSIRTIMYVAAALAVVALIAGQAVEGAYWAICVTVAVGSMVLCWVMYALFYAMVAAFARVALSRDSSSASAAYYPPARRDELREPESVTPAPEDT